MKNLRCIDFLQWSLPQLDYRWYGFKKVKKQVCRRISQRISELHLSGFSTYADYLGTNEDEWKILDSLCYISISRFFRDRSVFETIGSKVFPELTEKAIQQKRNELCVLSVGCCSGEEAYSINIVWHLDVLPKLETALHLKITATDNNENLLHRAGKGVYNKGSLRELSGDYIAGAFTKNGPEYIINQKIKDGIKFLNQDIRLQIPNGNFDLIFCRNLVFTYFEENLQKNILEKLLQKLNCGGFIVIGSHESLPETNAAVKQYKSSNSCIFQK